jgi:hypothetical protein
MKNKTALHFVFIIRIVDFFADFTYESARGIVGSFLGSLGGRAAIVSIAWFIDTAVMRLLYDKSVWSAALFP